MIKREDLTAELLDDLVHEVANDLASNANNGGVKEQLLFLNVFGSLKEADVLEKINAPKIIHRYP